MINLEIRGGGVTANVDIDDGVLSTTWTAAQPRAFGTAGGSVASWGTGAAWLQSGQAVPVLILNGLPGKTSGTGEKKWPDGMMPAGPVEWNIL